MTIFHPSFWKLANDDDLNSFLAFTFTYDFSIYIKVHLPFFQISLVLALRDYSVHTCIPANKTPHKTIPKEYLKNRYDEWNTKLC